MSRLDPTLLAPLPPFSKLTRDQIKEILDQATVRRFDAGVTVFQAGDQADRFYLILDGYIRVVRLTAEGEQIIALHIPSGQLFGIAPAIGRTTYPATAVTAGDTITLCWPTRLWAGFVAQYEGFGTESYKTVGARLDEMHIRVAEMATQHVEQRVANALLRLIRQTGRETQDGIEIDFAITRQDISEMTGTTLHTISRLLSSWQKDGVVESRRKHVLVREPQKLVALSQAP